MKKLFKLKKNVANIYIRKNEKYMKKNYKFIVKKIR